MAAAQNRIFSAAPNRKCTRGSRRCIKEGRSRHIDSWHPAAFGARRRALRRRLLASWLAASHGVWRLSWTRFVVRCELAAQFGTLVGHPEALSSGPKLPIGGRSRPSRTGVVPLPRRTAQEASSGTCWQEKRTRKKKKKTCKELSRRPTYF